MKKPQEIKQEIYSVDGDKLCEWVANKLNDERGWDLLSLDVYNYIKEHRFGKYDVELYQSFFELIIEDEDYCNADSPNDIREVVLMTIAEEFGGHFNIDFLSICAYLGGRKHG